MLIYTRQFYNETSLPQPRSQGLSSLPPLVVIQRPREAEKREPGNEVESSTLDN